MNRSVIKFIICFFIAFAICIPSLHSQTPKIDSLRKILQDGKNVPLSVYCDLGHELHKINPDSSILLAREGIALAEKSNDFNELCCNYNVLGLAYQAKGLFHQSIEACKTAASYGEKSGDPVNVAKALSNIAGTNLFLRNYSEAIKYELAAIEKFEAANDTGGLGSSYQDLSIIYRQTRQFDKAIEYIQRAKENFENIGRLEAVANCIASYGNIFLVMGKYDSSISKHLEAIKIYDKVGSISGKATSYENVGYNYYLKEDYKAALRNYEVAMKLYEQLNSEVDVATELMNTGEVLSKMGNYADALANLHSALKVFEKNNIDSYRSDAYKALSSTYESTGDTKAALEYHKKFMALQDSLMTEDQRSEILRLQTEFETVQKDNKIELLNHEKVNQQKELTHRKIMNYFLAGGIIMILILSYILWNRYQLKQKLKEVTIRNKIASDLHDDIGSSLSSINIVSQTLRNHISTDDETAKKLETIAHSSQDVMSSMSDIVWAINPANDTLDKLFIRMREFAARIFEPKEIDLYFNADESPGQLKLGMQSQRDLFLIFKEAINNAAKYSQCKSILITVKVGNTTLLMNIKDNGKGFDPSSIATGNGLQNMKQRATALKGILSIESVKGEGTVIGLTIPV